MRILVEWMKKLTIGGSDQAGRKTDRETGRGEVLKKAAL